MDPLSKLQYACKSNGPELLLDLSPRDWDIISKETDKLDRLLSSCDGSEEIFVLLLRQSIVRPVLIRIILRKRYTRAYVEYLRYLLLHSLTSSIQEWLKHWYLDFEIPDLSPHELLLNYHYDLVQVHRELIEWLTSYELSRITEQIQQKYPDFLPSWLSSVVLGVQYLPAMYSITYKEWMSSIQKRLFSRERVIRILSQVTDPELFRLLSREISVSSEEMPSQSSKLMCPTALEEDIREIAHMFSSQQIESIEQEETSVNETKIILQQALLKAVRLFYTPFDSSDIYKILVNSESPSRFKCLFCTCCALSKPIGLYNTSRWTISKRIQDQYCKQIVSSSLELRLPVNSVVPGQLWIVCSHHVCSNALISFDVFSQWIQMANRMQMTLFHEGKLQDTPGHANAYLTSETSFSFQPQSFESIEDAYQAYQLVAEKLYHTQETIVFQYRPSNGILIEYQTIPLFKLRFNYYYSLRAQVISTESDSVERSVEWIPSDLTDDVTSWNYLELERRRDDLEELVLSTRDPNLFSIYCTKILLAFTDWTVRLQRILFSSQSTLPLELLQSLLPPFTRETCIHANSPFIEWLFYTLSSRMVGFIPNNKAGQIFQITSPQIKDSSVNGYVVQTKIKEGSSALTNFLSSFDLMIKAHTVNQKSNAEIRVGYLINKLRLQCPHFVLTLGYIRCPSTDPFDTGDTLTICDNKTSTMVNYIIMEWIPHSRSFASFLKPEYQVDPMQQPKIIYNIMAQTLGALLWSHKTTGFTHYDLHLSNILCQSTFDCKSKLIYNLGYTIVTSEWHVYMIDYEYSYMKGIPKQKRISPKVEEETGVTSDRPAILADLFTFCTRLMYHLIRHQMSYVFEFVCFQVWLRSYVNLFRLVWEKSPDEMYDLFLELIRTKGEDRLRKLYNVNGEKYWFLRLSIREKIERTTKIEIIYKWVEKLISQDPLSQELAEESYTEINIPRI